MLLYKHFHKQITHRHALGCNSLPQQVYAYLQNENYAFKLIPATDFSKYEFVQYTYAESFFPVITLKKP